ncbi:hypothetical protein QCA50_003539 [Cerrena zonata]|uniref:GATA-type domain-containing protein n=1 Tax=Cerrena zonata TaxID=2478898 RepID=A0AAW0GSG1_9APHY
MHSADPQPDIPANPPSVHRPTSTSSLSSALGHLGPPGLGQRHPISSTRGPDNSPPISTASAHPGLTNLTNAPQLIQPGPPSVPQPTFEFTKRKRWADLLVTQLSEAILLILSPQMDVLYCGSAVWALLGWQDNEWVDKCLLDFMNLDDRGTFQRLFTESMVNRTELTSYIRLQYKPTSPTSISPSHSNTAVSYSNTHPGHAPPPTPYYPYQQQGQIPYQQQASSHGHGHYGALTASPQSTAYHHQQGYNQSSQRRSQRSQRDAGSAEGRKEVMFELVGAPYYLPVEDTLKCFYAVAKPYPSRNTTILNTFLELKLENERLVDRLSQLKLSKPKPPRPSTTSSTTIPTMVPSNNSNSNSLSTSPATPSTNQPNLSQGQGSSSSSSTIAIPSTNAFFPGSYNELIGIPGQGQVIQGVSAPRFRFENLFHEDGELTMDSADGVDGGAGMTGSGLEMGGQGGAGGGGGAGLVPPGPIGGTVVMGEDDESAKKKARKVYLPEQYVCMTCGRTDSPEWRKGPSGPKTLCNACGLRWAKREKEKRTALRASGLSGSSGPK